MKEGVGLESYPLTLRKRPSFSLLVVKLALVYKHIPAPLLHLSLSIPLSPGTFIYFHILCKNLELLLIFTQKSAFRCKVALDDGKKLWEHWCVFTYLFLGHFITVLI